MGKPKAKAPHPKSKGKVDLQQQQSPAVKKAKRTKPSPFASLPNEMVEHILEMLPIQDKKSARLVSSHWYQVLNRSVALKIPLKQETLVELRRQPYDINELEVVLNRVNIPPAFEFTKTMKDTFLTTKILNFMADNYYYHPDDGFWPQSNSLDGAGVVDLIKTCRNIHTLKFSFRFLEAFKMTAPIRLNNIQLEHLRTLQLKLAYGGQQEVSHTLLQIETPQLRNLEVERFRYGFGIGLEADRSIYMSLQRFIGRNKGTLKSLKLLDILTNITRTRAAPTTVFPADMLHDLGELKLESLEIQHSVYGFLGLGHGIDDWPAANQIMNQSSLKFLKLRMVSEEMFRKSYIVIVNCRSTLTNLDLNVRGAFVEFNMNVLSQLKCLTHLTFTYHGMVDTVLPPTIKYLTWNAPIHSKWYSSKQQNPPLFPALLKLRIGEPCSFLFSLAKLCQVLFGISPIGGDSSTRTKLQLIILGRTVRSSEAVETRNQYKRRNLDVAEALRLPQEIYHVVHDLNNIRIGIQSGISI